MSEEQINLRVKDNVSFIFLLTFSSFFQQGNDIGFKLKKSTKLKKLMTAFCKRTGYPEKGVKFIKDGNVIKEQDSPESLHMVDQDEIEAVIEQVGGGFTQ